MNWGKWIIVTFVVFALFMAGLVAVCMREDISLVSRNYYQDELSYQQQIERLNNAKRLQTQPEMAITKEGLKIQFPLNGHVQSGTIQLLRPSDLRWDRNFRLSAERTTQVFDISTLPQGMYRAKMQWTMDGKEYQVESVIHI